MRVQAANDNERAVERVCDRCGLSFERGSFLIVAGGVVSVMCGSCHDPADDFTVR